MDVCALTELRGHLRERLDQVYSTRRPLLIARQNAAAAVVIDKEECDGIMETLPHVSSLRKASNRVKWRYDNVENGTYERTMARCRGSSPCAFTGAIRKK